MPRIKKGDTVQVITGAKQERGGDRGKQGKVLAVDFEKNRVIVEGVNMIKRHTRQTQTTAGGIIEREAPIHVSNLAIEDPRDGQPSRVGYKTLDDGRKVRFAKRSGEVIDV